MILMTDNIKKNQHLHFLVHGHSSWSTFGLHLVKGPWTMKTNILVTRTMEVVPWSRPTQSRPLTWDDFMVHSVNRPSFIVSLTEPINVKWFLSSCRVVSFLLDFSSLNLLFELKCVCILIINSSSLLDDMFLASSLLPTPLDRSQNLSSIMSSQFPLSTSSWLNS